MADSRVRLIAGRLLTIVCLLVLVAGTSGCRKPRDPQNPGEVKKKLSKVTSLVLWKVDADDAQKKQIDGLLTDLSVDMFAVQQDNNRILRQAMDALDADTVDAAALEKVAVDGAALFERYLRRMLRAAGDITRILTADQRHKAIKMWREWEFGK